MTPDKKSVYGECLEYFYNCSVVFHQATKEKFVNRDDELFVVMASCLNTAQGAHKLASIVQTENEAVMLMRALLERLVNYNYLRQADELEYEKYWLYPYYRMYHNTKQEVKSERGSLRVTLDHVFVQDFKKHSKVKKALEVFSDTDSRLSWTTKTFNQRVNKVIKTSKLSRHILLISSLLTYKSASESLHGSMYGLMQLTGLFEVHNNFDLNKLEQKQVRKNIEQNLGFRLVLLGFLMADTAYSIAIDYQNDLLKDDSTKQKSAMVKLLKKLDKKT